jgi:hypothetical protein
MCQPYTLPEVRLELPAGAKLADLPPVENVDVKVKGREVRIVFEDRGQSDEALPALHAIAKGFASLPPGTRVELDAARPRATAGTRSPGLHRYRGVVEGGQWRIAESFPPVEAKVLAEALALAEAAELGKSVALRDEAEARAIEARVLQHAADFFHANPLLRDGSVLSVKRRDPAAITQVALRAFRARYADTWPIEDTDEETSG